MKVRIGKYPKKGDRKISIQIDPWDTWSMDHTLALLIHPMLKQLIKAQHGAPHTDDEDVPEELRSTNAKPKKNDYDVDQFHFKRWDWIMKEMIWAFGEIAKDRDPNFFIKRPKYKRVPVEGEEWTELVCVDPGIYDEIKAKAYYARKKNAFRLFGKYYENLWD